MIYIPTIHCFGPWDLERFTSYKHGDIENIQQLNKYLTSVTLFKIIFDVETNK